MVFCFVIVVVKVVCFSSVWISVIGRVVAATEQGLDGALNGETPITIVALVRDTIIASIMIVICKAAAAEEGRATAESVCQNASVSNCQRLTVGSLFD